MYQYNLQRRKGLFSLQLSSPKTFGKKYSTKIKLEHCSSTCWVRSGFASQKLFIQYVFPMLSMRCLCVFLWKIHVRVAFHYWVWSSNPVLNYQELGVTLKRKVKKFTLNLTNSASQVILKLPFKSSLCVSCYSYKSSFFTLFSCQVVSNPM